MTITARYAGTCALCRGLIAVGQSIQWSRGTRARHADCEDQLAEVLESVSSDSGQYLARQAWRHRTGA